MRIYITSDTHNSLELPGFKDDGTFDAIFHCGDFTNFGYMTKDSKDYIVFNKYAGIKTPIYFVPGNHDIGVRNKNMFTPHNKGKNVLNKLVQFTDNYMMYGFSLSPCYNKPDLYATWDNMVLDEEVEKNYYLNAPYADIIISHCPPKNCLMDITSEGISIGSIGLYEYILEKQPKYVFCGHVHQKEIKYYNLCGTNIYNVATNYLDLDI